MFHFQACMIVIGLVMKSKDHIQLCLFEFMLQFPCSTILHYDFDARILGRKRRECRQQHRAESIGYTNLQIAGHQVVQFTNRLPGFFHIQGNLPGMC
ncbi:hypothetical protein D3C87_1749640 [compost metagenome]